MNAAIGTCSLSAGWKIHDNSKAAIAQKCHPAGLECQAHAFQQPTASIEPSSDHRLESQHKLSCSWHLRPGSGMPWSSCRNATTPSPKVV